MTACSPRTGRPGYALIAPVVIVLLLITAYPLFYNVWNSFHNVDYLNPATFGTWAGVSNYTRFCLPTTSYRSRARSHGRLHRWYPSRWKR